MTAGTRSYADEEHSGWSGWVLFASVILFIVGCVNGIVGLVALFKETTFAIPEKGLLVTTDWTAWGVVMLIWAALLILVALGLGSGQGWARWVAIVLVGLNLIAQFTFFPAYPLWSAVVIGLDVLVLFALTVRWRVARAELRG